MKFIRDYTYMILLIVLVLAMGTIGYLLLLDISFIDALYMTVITVSTVGYTEVADMHAPAKIFSIILIIISISVLSYVITNFVSSLFEGDFQKNQRRKRMNSAIEKLSDHFIVCGQGRTGHYLIQQLESSNAQFVIIEKDPAVVETLTENGFLVVEGDATKDETLERAKINTAKGLVTCLPKDTDNLFVVLTARAANKNLYIVSRGIDPSSTDKLKTAGADRTVLTSEMGGNTMALMLLHPYAETSFERILHDGDATLNITDILLEDGSDFDGKELRETKFKEKSGLIIIGIKKKTEDQFIFDPDDSQKIHTGDILTVIGSTEQLEKIRASAKGTQA